MCFTKHGALVGREVDHAVRDDHVDRAVGKWDLLDRALEERRVGDACLGLVRARHREHFVGHVHAVGVTVRRHAPRGEQDVQAGAAPQVEHTLARTEVG